MNIVELLKRNNEVSDYKINTKKVKTYELYFVHEQLETVRSTNTKETTVTIYHRHENKIGDASFNVYVNTSEEQFEDELNKALVNAKAINNQDYQLVKAEQASAEIPSNFSQYNIEDLASQIANICFECQKEHTKINALEIFLYEKTKIVENSLGLNKSEKAYECMVEAIPTFNGENLSVELYEQYHFTTFDENKLRQEIEEKLLEVENRYLAQIPLKKLNCPVILRTNDLGRLMREFVGDLGYNYLYSNSNIYKVNDAIQTNPTGDLLTIELKGQIEGSSYATNFDSDGSTLKDVVIIKDGKVANNHGTNRFAQYLDKPNTGDLFLVKIQPGSTNEQELLSKEHLEIISTSGLMADLSADYVGGEVRLAYYFDGKTTTPITGISISSKISDALNNMKLSSKTTSTNMYEGPTKALFTTFEIL